MTFNNFDLKKSITKLYLLKIIILLLGLSLAFALGWHSHLDIVEREQQQRIRENFTKPKPSPSPPDYNQLGFPNNRDLVTGVTYNSRLWRKYDNGKYSFIYPTNTKFFEEKNSIVIIFSGPTQIADAHATDLGSFSIENTQVHNTALEWAQASRLLSTEGVHLKLLGGEISQIQQVSINGIPAVTYSIEQRGNYPTLTKLFFIEHNAVLYKISQSVTAPAEDVGFYWKYNNLILDSFIFSQQNDEKE
ncbi:hypothetical protein KC686_04105 [Candidatus Woesebacteria bacterium]|nr:hypothetical protein [Candidatus Woesebacteria bacterium]